MKIGDKVRFLSEVGGGVVTGFQGKRSGSRSASAGKRISGSRGQHQRGCRGCGDQCSGTVRCTESAD